MPENPRSGDIGDMTNGLKALFEHAHGKPTDEYRELVAAGERYRQEVIEFGQSCINIFTDPPTNALIRRYASRHIKYMAGIPIYYAFGKPNHLYRGIFLRGEDKPELVVYFTNWINKYTPGYTHYPTPEQIAAARRAFERETLTTRGEDRKGWNFYFAEEDGSMITDPRGHETLVAARRFKPEDLMEKGVLPYFFQGVGGILDTVNRGLEEDALQGMPRPDLELYTEALNAVREILNKKK